MSQPTVNDRTRFCRLRRELLQRRADYTRDTATVHDLIVVTCTAVYGAAAGCATCQADRETP